MALLTLPTEMLRGVGDTQALASPHGERQERLFALTLALLMVGAPLVLVVMR
jgi:hypothetical protein